MSAPFQVLPPLSDDDRRRLADSIRERGVEVPIVVDEAGDVIDGHHRQQIAAELGIDCPRVVKAGLSGAEKRVLAVTLNLARRQMTDAQKVMAGQAIEADVAAVAAERRRAAQNNASAAELRSSGQLSGTEGETRDQVAATVGLGSGRTYERGKQVLADLADEPDGAQLVGHVESGDWDLDDARTELRDRGHERYRPRPPIVRQRLTDDSPDYDHGDGWRDDAPPANDPRRDARAEVAEGERLLSIVGDPNGTIARAKVRYRFVQVSGAARDLTLMDTDAVVDALDEGDMQSARWLIRDVRAWLDRLEASLGRGVRLVKGSNA